MDYSLSSGHRWYRIRNEIINVLGIEASDRNPLLSRQDLEHWAEGKSVLGDEKFKLVYAFLTHPTSLKRPEFSRFQLLFGGIQQARRVGTAMTEFFGAPPTSPGLEPWEV